VYDTFRNVTDTDLAVIALLLSHNIDARLIAPALNPDRWYDQMHSNTCTQYVYLTVGAHTAEMKLKSSTLILQAAHMSIYIARGQSTKREAAHEGSINSASKLNSMSCKYRKFYA
jgi:hypothetical protein